MVVNCILLAIILFGYSFAQSSTAKSSNLLYTEATVEIQYNSEVGSGIILMTSCLASCTALVTSNSSTIISSLSTATSSISTTTLSKTTILIASIPSITATWTSSTSSIYFNILPLFGTSRIQIINATSIGQYLFPTATGSSQEKTGAMATQYLFPTATGSSQGKTGTMAI
jgi:hypothetical protein